MTVEDKNQEKEQFKKALWFINAHRDGCCGQYVANHLNISNEDLVKLFRKMYEQKLISFPNVQSDTAPTDEDILESIVLISAGYTHPDYKDIY